MSLERMFNNLACVLLFCYAYFAHVLRCSKQVFQTKIYPKKVLTQKFDCFFFSETPIRSHKFQHLAHGPPFENFSLDALNSEQKTSEKNQSNGPVRNWWTGRSTCADFLIYRLGRVEKILVGSIPGRQENDLKARNN